MSLKSLRLKADKSIWNHQKVCEVCGDLDSVPHHFIGRGNKTLRWDLRNVVWLCIPHHTSGDFSAHGSPTEFKDWFKKYRLYDYEYLLKKKNEIVKFTETDMKKIIKDLE